MKNSDHWLHQLKKIALAGEIIQPPCGNRIGQGRRCDCATAQWSWKSAIEGSPVATRATAAGGWHRLLQKIPFKDNGQFY
jgi:hypothetical protein